MDKDIKAQWFLIAYYEWPSNKCFDEDSYEFKDFEKAYEYYKSFNESNKFDYVKLYAYINDEIGLILIGDKPAAK